MNDRDPTTVGAAPVTSLALGELHAASELDGEEDRVLAARLAGGFYLALALLTLPLLGATAAGPVNPMGFIFDVGVSCMLLGGQLKVRNFALFRVGVAIVIDGVAALSTGSLDFLVTGLVLVFMALLLVGTPSPRRRRVGIALAVVLVGLSAVAVVAELI